MKVLIRADSSVLIGTGHVMRSSVLAQALKEAGAEITYACRAYEGNFIRLLEMQGFAVRGLPVDAVYPVRREDCRTWLGGDPAQDVEASFGGEYYDLVIIDHYGATAMWQRLARKYCRFILCIDDEAVEKQECDILLNPNFFTDPSVLYDGKLPEGCERFIGSAYALLRPEFGALRGGAAVRSQLRHLLVMMGGSDPADISRKIAEALPEDFKTTVVVGNAYRNFPALEKLCRAKGFTALQNTDRIGALMRDADFCIGAAGTSSWERCCLRLPAALFILAENQRAIAENLHHAGAAYNLGQPDSYDFKGLPIFLARHHGEGSLSAMSEKAGMLVDGKGVARVMEGLAIL